MKILQLSAENFKRISVVQITPTGNLVQITGKNASGKTSVLDAIWATLAGAEHLQAEPIRKGEDKATLKLTLGGPKPEMIATRTIRKKKDGPGFNTTLTVESADGFRAPQPQQMMDRLLGALTLDPLAFMRLNDKDKFNAMRTFVPDVDFDDIAAKNRSDYSKRTEVNRDAKKARAAEEAIQVPDSIDAETQSIDEAALTQELAGAGAHNATIERRKERRDGHQQMIDAEAEALAGIQTAANAAIKTSLGRADTRSKEIEAEITRLRIQLSAINQAAELEQNEIAAKCSIDISQVKTDTTKMREALAAAEPLPEPIDTEELTARIATARWTNEAIRQRDQRARHKAEADRLDAEAQALTDAMAARDKQKADAIAKAELPVAGLDFGDGVVTFNGLPLEQASDAEQLRLSIALAMASNSKLRVIRVRDGSLLDDDGMKLLIEMADEKDFQVWIERVASDGKVGFVLEDGALKVETAKEGALL